MEGTSPCLICYRRCKRYLQEQEDVSSPAKLKKFFHFFEGYLLHQRKPPDGKEKATLENLINAGMHCCEDCLKVVEPFCDLYHQLKSVELLLDWKVQSLENILVSARRIPNRMKNFRNHVKGLDIGNSSDGVCTDEAIELILNFKWELIQKCKQKRLATVPRLTLNRSEAELADTPVLFDSVATPSRIGVLNDNVSPPPAIPICTETEDEDEMENVIPCTSIVKSEPEVEPLETLKNSSPRLRKIYRCSTCRSTFSDSSKLEKHQLGHGNDDWSWSKPDSTFEEVGNTGNGSDVDEDHVLNFDCNDANPDEDSDLDCKDDIQNSEIGKVSSENQPFKSGRQRGMMTSRIQNLQDKTLKCRLCGREFTSVSNRNRHHRDIHLRIKSYKCQACSKSFQRRQLLMRHHKENVDCAVEPAKTRVRYYRCYICSEDFTKVCDLKSHVKTHSAISSAILPVETDNRSGFHDIKHYTQDSKPSQFSINTKDDTEAAGHYGLSEKYSTDLTPSPGSSSQIRKSNNSPNNKCTKTPETNKFRCNICSQEFYNLGNCNRHQKEVHLRVKRFKCQFCNLKFFYKYSLSDHLKRTKGCENRQGKLKRQTLVDNQKSRKGLPVSSSSSPVPIHSEGDEDHAAEIPTSMDTNGTVPSVRKSSSAKRSSSRPRPKRSYERLGVQGVLNPETGHIKCTHCPKEFRLDKGFKQHYKREHLDLNLDRKWTCNLCGKQMNYESSLRFHMQTAHLKKKCQTKTGSSCGLKRSYERLGVQSVLNPETGRFKCTQCPKEFSGDKSFKVHYMSVHLKRKWTCNLCGKQMGYETSFRVHMKTVHLGVKYKCQKCHYPFSQRNGLRLHLRTSSCGEGEEAKPPVLHKCDFCEKEFYPRSRLTYHLQSVHLKVREYLCSECGKGFMQPSSLTKHMKTMHTESRELCDLCGREFKHKSSLAKHYLKHHQQKLSKKRLSEPSGPKIELNPSIHISNDDNCGKDDD